MRFFHNYLVGLLLFTTAVLPAQEQIGIQSMRRAGINGAAIQPASTINHPDLWDANLFEFSQHLTTNYGFLSNTGLLQLARIGSDGRFYRIGEEDAEKSAAQNSGTSVLYDYYPGREKRYAYNATSVMGPSFSISLGEMTRIGFTTRFRVVASAFDLDEDFSFYPYYNREYLNGFSVSPFDLSGAAWSEVGINFARAIETTDGQWNLGITARYLVGHRAGYFRNLENFEFEKVNLEQVSGANVELEAGLTDNLSDLDNLVPERTGAGVGIDVGIQYMTGQGPDGGYRWVFGASLLDFGGINFNQGAQQHRFSGDSLTVINATDYTDLYKSFVETKDIDILDVVERASEDILNDPDASRVANQFFMRLPTAVSLQADYAVTETVAVNATVIGGLPSNNSVGIERGTMVAVTPRYETKWYAASLPVVFQNGRELRMGAAFRVGFLTFGSEDLGSIFGQQEVNGTDFYAGIRLFPFNRGGGRSGWSPIRVRNRRSSQKVDCYKF